MTTRSPRVTRISTRLFFRESILYQWLSQRVNAFLLHCVYKFRLLLDFTTAFWCSTYVTNFAHQKYAWLHMVCEVVSGFKLFNLVIQHVKWYDKYKSSDGSKMSAPHNLVQFFPCSVWKKIAKIMGWSPHPWNWCSLLWEVLDPPLLKVSHGIYNYLRMWASNFQEAW